MKSSTSPKTATKKLVPIILFQVVLARSKANLQSDTLSVSLGTSVSINAVANLNPGEKVKK